MMIGPFLLLLASTPQPVVAVFDLQSRAIGRRTASNLTDYVATRLAATGRYKVVPRASLRRALSAEKVASYRPCFDDACQIEIGKEVAAEKTLTSKVSRIGPACVVTLTLYDLRESATEAAGSARGTCTEQGVLDALDRALVELTGVPRRPEAVPVLAARRAPEPTVSLPRPPAPAVALADLEARPAPEDLQRLEKELAAMERLLTAAHRGSDDRAFLLLRVSRTLRTVGAARRRAGDHAGARRALSRRAKLLGELAGGSPQHPRMDEILLALSGAQRALGRTRQARRTLLRLVQTERASPLIGEAYAALADLSGARAARRFYGRALRGGDAKIAAYAAYRRAHLHWRGGRSVDADRDFVRAARIASKAGRETTWGRAIAGAANADRARLHHE